MFRKEVLNASAEHKHGSVILIRPVSSWIFVACTVFIVASITAYLVLGSYTKRATATGSLLPVNGLVRIIPPIAGMVSERRVEEGQHVRKGDILFVLSDERSQVNGGKIIALREIHATSLEQRRISLQRAREASQLLAKQAQHGLKNKIVMLKNELSHNNQQVDLQKSRVNAAIKILQKHIQLEQEQFISTLALQEKEDAVAAQRSQLLSLQRQNTELKRNLVAIEDELHQIPTRTDQELADIDRDFGVLAQETAELQTRDRYAITAPLDSIVTSITAQVGQPINGQALAILLPVDAQLEANLYLPSRAIGFIEIGQKVRLRYQAYPYQKFGQYDGIVKEIARSPIPVNELPMASPLISQEVVYRVTVKLAAQYILAYGKQIMLRPGMALEADIEQERRRLIEWILEPLYGFHKYFP